MTRAQLADHRLYCEEAMVKCPFAFKHVECLYTCRRKDLDEHLDEAAAHSAHMHLLDYLQPRDIIPVVAMLSYGTTDYPKFAAAVAIQRLARIEENKVAIVAAGALSPLIAMLSKTGSLQVQAANALLALDLEVDVADIIIVDTVAPLVAVLRGGGSSNSSSVCMNNRVKEAVARVLMYLAGHANNLRAINWDGAIAILIAMLHTDHIDATTQAAIGALVRLAMDDNYMVAIVRMGAAPLLVALLRMGSVAAAKALHKLSYRDENQMAIIQAGAIVPLLAILEHDNEHDNDEQRDLASRTLANLSYAIMQAATHSQHAIRMRN